MTDEPLPTPERIRDYLVAHGWREESCLPPAGTMFALGKQTDSGCPITVFLPELETAIDYSLRVTDVFETLSAVEDRPKAAILTDILPETGETVLLKTLPRVGTEAAESVSGTGRP